MLFFTRTMLPAFALAAMLSTAQAQTATGSEHEGHHPEGAAPAAQFQPAPAPTPGTQPGMNMGGMMGGGMMGQKDGQAGMMCGMMGQKGAQAGMTQSGILGGGMMGHQGGMGMPFEHTEGRIAFLKAELGITDAQTAQWNTLADAMRANAKIHRTMHEHMTKGGMPSSWSERLTFQQKALSSRLDGLKAMEAAAKPLFAVLTEDQKKLAEQLLSGPMGMV
jgi:hypothetical protein